MQNNKLKICFFGDVAARHLFRWAKYFADNGHEVHIITFNSSLVDDYDKIKVHIIRKYFPGSGIVARALSLVPMVFQIKRLVKEINPDVVHSHDAGGYAWMGALSGFHPFIITPWGSDILVHIKISRVEMFLTKFALQKADIITCDGENMKEAIEKLGIISRKIKLIIFGVDIEKFKPAPEKKILKERLFSSESKIAISTRFLTSIHDVETFVRAMPIVLNKFPAAKFVLIGDGDQKDYLMDLAKKLGIAENVKFAGRVSEEEMAFYLHAADIYVSTSLSESGLAASTAEAMACGLPVINTDTGDIKLWINDGESGFIIPVKNPEILAKKIIYLFENDEARIKAGKINRKIIEERNNYYKEMSKMEKIYKEIAKN